MSLRTKIALALFSAVVLFAGVDLVLRQASFAKRFDGLEDSRALEQFGRFERALGAFQGRLVALAEGHAGAPGGSRTAGPSRGPVDLTGALEGEPAADFAAIYDASGRLRDFEVKPTADRGQVFEGELEALGGVVLTPDYPGMPGHPIRRGLDAEGRAVGLWAVRAGVVLIGAARVVGGGGETLFSFRGSLLGSDLIEELQEASFTRTKLAPALSSDSDLQARIESLVDVDGVHMAWGPNGARRVSALLRDVKGAPALMAELDVPQELQVELGGLWSDLRRDSLFSALALALLFPLVILLLLQGIVTGPLTRLTRHAAMIGSSDDTELRLGLGRGDEIGQLANEFDLMLEKLSASRAEVVRTARVAGIAEISAGVMHNIGNALNSVHVSAALVRERIREIRPERLAVVLEQLERHQGHLDEYLADDPKGSQLLGLFEALVAKADKSVANSSEEIGELVSGVERIAAMVASLQATHERQELVEHVQLCELIDEAVELCAQATGRTDVEVQRSYSVRPQVELDGNKLSQALCHVLHNAFEHLEPERQAKIEIAVRPGAGELLEIEVSDNGCGIEPERLGTIFQGHSSTKSNGSGLGLHLAATAIGEFGGHIRAESDGPGQGARFRISLPQNAVRTAA